MARSMFYKIKIADITRETDDCVSVGLDIPEELRETFSHKAGQYLTFRFQLGGKEYRRSYSICSSPYEKDYRIAVKRVEEGVISSHFNQNLGPGDVLEATPPKGTFQVSLDRDNQKTYVFFAAGSGITPVMSVVKAIIEKEPHSMVILFYGNRDENSIIFKQHLDKFARQHPLRLELFYILSQPTLKDHKDIEKVFGKTRPYPEQMTGRLGTGKTNWLLDEYVDFNNEAIEFFICGPSGMMEKVIAVLKERSVPEKKIHREYFTTPVDEAEEYSETTIEKAETSKRGAEATIILDDQEYVVEVGPDDTLLDAALDADIDAPFSCRGAVCSTCMAKILEGKVEMEMNYVLMDAEIEDGFILTCQSHPLTDKVKITYDV